MILHFFFFHLNYIVGALHRRLSGIATVAAAVGVYVSLNDCGAARPSCPLSPGPLLLPLASAPAPVSILLSLFLCLCVCVCYAAAAAVTWTTLQYSFHFAFFSLFESFRPCFSTIQEKKHYVHSDSIVTCLHFIFPVTNTAGHVVVSGALQRLVAVGGHDPC